MKIIGHRGARGLAPENTLASLDKAIEHDVDMIEFDVRVTRDGYAILYHDSDVCDPSGNRLKISGNSLAELKTHKADLALFEDGLKFINHRAGVIIEIKPAVDIRPIVAIIKKSGWDMTEIIIGSFSFDILKQVKKALPSAQIMVIESWSGVRATWRARRLGTRLISLNQRWLWPGFIKSVGRSYQLYTYTLNNPDKAARWSRYGLSGVITDYPDIM